MGTNNVGGFQPNFENLSTNAAAQKPETQSAPIPSAPQADFIYNIPAQSLYGKQNASSEPAQFSFAQNLIFSYISKLSQNQTQEVSKTQAVSEANKTDDVWHNDLKQKLRGGKAHILAVIPRTMNAKDTDGNGLIQDGEMRGTFMNAVERLDEIKDMGINTLHVLPIHPPGKKNAMGIAGSVYAPEDLLKIDPMLRDPNYEGSVEDQFKIFVNEAHKRGIAIMLDLPSCVSVDFAEKHPELMAYEKDGNDKTPGGWQDIRMFKPFADEAKEELNPHLIELHRKYVDMYQGYGIDGIRADVGRAKPAKFWASLIDYSRQKDQNFGWLAENYTYEDASPQVNMPHDRPEELLKAGFDAFYGQWHIINQWTKAPQIRNYINEHINIQKDFADKEPRAWIGSGSTHDDQSPMFYGGSPWCQFTSILLSTIPLCNPYFVDGVQSGDYYLYPYEGAYAPKTETDTNECVVHPGYIDIFNPSRKPGGNNPEIGMQISNMLHLRDDKKYSDVITKGSICWLKPVQEKNSWEKFKGFVSGIFGKPQDKQKENDEIIAFARQYGDKTLLVVGNRNLNKRNNAKISLSDMKEGQQLTDLTLPYGKKSRIQTGNGELNIDLAPSRIHVFEINAPNIEHDSFDVSKFVNGIYTKVK